MNLLEEFTLKKRAKVNPKVLDELKPKKETTKKSTSKKTTKK